MLYKRVPVALCDDDDGASKRLLESSETEIRTGRPRIRSLEAVIMGGVAAVVIGLVLLVLVAADSQSTLQSSRSCDTVAHGYRCEPELSHIWGQYSPYYSVASEIDDRLPLGCSVDQASVLSRHGARDPTLSKTLAYKTLVSRIKADASSLVGKYAFLQNYTYVLGADQLTVFGQQQMVNSGTKFYSRYRSLGRVSVPFTRASGEQRVVDSAVNFTQGFDQARGQDGHAKKPRHSYPLVVIPETAGTNNTLNHDICTAFESGPADDTADAAQAQFAAVFTPSIRQRLNHDLPGVNFTESDVINLMSICPFETVASETGRISQFCRLFSLDEWRGYDYYQSLGKYYGYGAGNELGPTQGVGLVNELLARLTNRPVQDETTTNSTLDRDPDTFPLDQSLYADFSHDNDMTSVFFALGLYNQTEPLSNTTRTSPRDAHGYSAAWTAPFASRAYFERISCGRIFGRREQYVRVLVNDRVIPLQNCNADRHGLCLLENFVSSQSFARTNGKWSSCFT